MIHEISSQTEGKLTDMEVDVEHIKQLNSRVYREMSKNCNRPEEYFLTMLQEHRHDVYFDAQEALRHGLIDHIGIPTLEVKVAVDMQLVNGHTN